MERRKFLIGAGSLAAGGAAALGSGAFSSVRADRTVSVSTASDADALLAFDTTDAANKEYVETSGGQVNIQLTDSSNYDEDGTGVNQNAVTRIFDLFKVRNQGTQNVFVYVEPGSIASENRVDVDNSLGVDPQASGRPDDTDTSYGNSDPNNLAQIRDEISLTGRFGAEFPETDLRGYNKESYILEPGQDFNFGLYISGGTTSDASLEVDMTINAVADYGDFGSS
ncbi:hypothetical protein [Halovenus halobia]|uniref:hypothetical protein n=1 Tax=Halovenus halobia TaxID=3396622 RepID=UPI003F57A1A0